VSPYEVEQDVNPFFHRPYILGSPVLVESPTVSEIVSQHYQETASSLPTPLLTQEADDNSSLSSTTILNDITEASLHDIDHASSPHLPPNRPLTDYETGAENDTTIQCYACMATFVRKCDLK
jgi:hypothetical protein